MKAPEGYKEVTTEDFLQPGTKQVCAGYALYGPSTMLVITSGHGVNGFTLDRNVGEYFLTHPNIQIPADTKEFAINASNARFWEKPVQHKNDEKMQGKDNTKTKNNNKHRVASM